MIKWKIEQPGLHTGIGDHALYQVKQLMKRETGVRRVVKLGWYTARKLGDNPYRVVGGPYRTALEAKNRALSLDGGL